MQIPLQLTFRSTPRSEAIEARIREKVAALERFHPRIMSCRVTVAESSKHQRQGRLYEVHVELRIPGRDEIVADRHPDEDINVALRNAFESVTRQLEDAARGHGRSG